MTHILLSFIFYNILLIIFYYHFKCGNKYIGKKNLLFYTILLIAFATYGTGEGDYLHYKENVELFRSLADVSFYRGMEIHYNYLAYFLEGNYTLWRLVIFSLQFVGMSWLLHKAKLDTYPVFFSLVAICLVLYTYQRSYWGVIFYFLGIYLLQEKKNPLFIIIIVLSYFSHTQNLVLLGLLPLGFINLRSWHLLLVFLFMGVIAATLKDYFNYYLDSGGVENAEYLNYKVDLYSRGGKGNFGNSIGEQITFFIRYIPVVIIVLIWLKLLFTKRKKYLSLYKPFRRVVNIMIALVITSLVILLSDLGSGTFFYRILAMTLFPVSMIMPEMVKNKIMKEKLFYDIIGIFVFATEVSYFKSIYYAHVVGV